MITVVIPVFNENEMVVKKSVTSINEMLLDFGKDYEIIVVDDGSATPLVIEKEENIYIKRHKTNRGYGAALKTGINASKYDMICITDADGTYPNEKISGLLSELIKDNLDMIVGARNGKNVKIPLVRRPAKWAIGRLANWVTGKQIPDINSGLRIFKKESFIPFQHIVPNGFSFTTTITLGMLSGGYKVRFKSIDYFQRIGNSKIRPVRDTLNFVKLILRIGLYFAPLTIFMPISVLLFLGAVFWGIFTKQVFGELADVSSLIIAMTGFQIAALALIAELINHRLPNKYMK